MKRPEDTTNPLPHPSLKFDPEAEGLTEFSRGFYRLDTVQVAQRLLGAWLARRNDGHWYGARIVETEAYLGSRDPAAHSRNGRRTRRIEPMYMDGGHLYVFLVYGMHHCTNIVTRIPGTAEAVLLRAAEGPPNAPKDLLKGPGKLSRALGITVASSGTDLLSSENVRLYHNGSACDSIGRSHRIGVEYAGKAAEWPLRFFDMRSPSVSGPARLRKKVPENTK